MKKIKCRFLFFYGSDFMKQTIVGTVNQVLTRLGFGDIQLEMAGKQIADVSIVDSISNIRGTQGIVLFFSNELSVHNPLLMDYSILLTRSSSPHSYQTKRTLKSMGPFLNRLARSSSPHGDLSSADTVCSGVKQTQTAKTRFCCFVRRRSIDWRNRFVQSLSRRKRVDCPGRCLNNMETIGPKVEDKFELMSHYKFVIAFENSIYPSYLTEKIFHALQVGAVPIYWGDPEVTRWVNPKAFINVSDFPTIEAAIDHIMEVDRKPELYAAYQNAEPFLADSAVYQDSEENFARFLKTVCDQVGNCLLYTSPSPRDRQKSRMPSSA